MPGDRMKNKVRTWRDPGFDDALFLSAEFREQRFDRHFHDEFAIGVIDSGCQAFVYEGRRLDMPGGSVALISPGLVHSGWPGADEGWRYRMFYPSANLVAQAVEDIFGTRRLATFHRPVVYDHVLSAGLARLHALSERQDGDRLEAESLYLAIIRRAFEQHAGERRRPEKTHDRTGLSPMRELIETRFDGPIALDELARAAGLSRFQAVRHFKAKFGLPPHAYLRHVRIRHAHMLIRRGGGLADVAAAAGFADQAHMTRAFRQTVGYTPGALSR
jgi:AraC-like DNA-binding protein